MLLTPEQKLWRAVLGQAYADAECAPGEIEADDFAPADRTSARHFLRADTSLDADALGAICDSAVVPCDRVVLWARRRYAAAA
jgi:hypothetical protein